jgi:hypothetical protein
MIDLTTPEAIAIIKAHNAPRIAKARIARFKKYGEKGTEAMKKYMARVSKARWDKYYLTHPKKENK